MKADKWDASLVVMMDDEKVGLMVEMMAAKRVGR